MWFRDRVKSCRTERMAAQEPTHSESSSANPAMLGDRLCGIFGAGWSEAAGVSKNRREPALIPAQQNFCTIFSVSVYVHACVLPLVTAASDPANDPAPFRSDAVFCAMASKARAISAPSATKSMSKTAFLGLITTSTALVTRPKFWPTAARMRRLMRLRRTAPPNWRPTVIPTRGPSLWVPGRSR